MTPTNVVLISSHQKYWDACLIKVWRAGGQLLDAVLMFKSITGKDVSECNLKRTPPGGMAWKMGVRVFVAEFLPKISARLWEQEPSKDVALLKALEKSSYTTCQRTRDRELAKTKREAKQNETEISMLANKIASRNRKTDWGVTKSPSKFRRN